LEAPHRPFGGIFEALELTLDGFLDPAESTFFDGPGSGGAGLSLGPKTVPTAMMTKAETPHETLFLRDIGLAGHGLDAGLKILSFRRERRSPVSERLGIFAEFALIRRASVLA